MKDRPPGGKVIPFRRPAPGSRKPYPASATQPSNAIEPAPAPQPASRLPHARLLESLHPRVRAVLVLRDGKWEVFERKDAGDPAPGILQSVSQPEFVRVLAKSVALPAQESRRGIGLVSGPAERITLSPWPGFDLALLLREGMPVYGLWLQPDTSIYIAEEMLPVVARYFDAGPDRGNG